MWREHFERGFHVGHCRSRCQCQHQIDFLVQPRVSRHGDEVDSAAHGVSHVGQSLVARLL